MIHVQVFLWWFFFGTFCWAMIENTFWIGFYNSRDIHIGYPHSYWLTIWTKCRYMDMYIYVYVYVYVYVSIYVSYVYVYIYIVFLPILSNFFVIWSLKVHDFARLCLWLFPAAHIRNFLWNLPPSIPWHWEGGVCWMTQQSSGAWNQGIDGNGMMGINGYWWLLMVARLLMMLLNQCSWLLMVISGYQWLLVLIDHSPHSVAVDQSLDSEAEVSRLAWCCHRLLMPPSCNTRGHINLPTAGTTRTHREHRGSSSEIRPGTISIHNDPSLALVWYQMG